jgi:serine phosphatase RsbU (regulator of sigma subunit)
VHPPGAAGAAGADADAPVRSRISVPLEAGLDALGSLSVAVVDRERPEQTAADEALLREVADRASVVLTRARLRESEHRVAVRLQEALLPGALRHPPSVQVAARYAAGSDLLEVGGDWYDAFELPGGRVALAVGDVVGHGLEAAATMGRLRVALHALAPHAAGPAALLSHLDGFAAAAQVTDYATVCAVEVEPATGALRYARAGHPPPLVVAPDGTTTWLDRAGSMPLHGAPRPAPRPEATATLAPGALLVLYSDGLVERRGEDLDARLARLASVASNARDLDLGAVCDRLLAAMDVAAARDDDVVVLCLRLAAAP